MTSSNVPEFSPEAIAQSGALRELIAQEIKVAGGWIPFSRYMELALYTPTLGYYSGGLQKFGESGDFTTAPQMSKLFGRALARQISQVNAHSAPYVLEVGAGSGQLALDVLEGLEALESLPERYFILDISTDLRQRQKELLQKLPAHLFDRVSWLEQLPQEFSGSIIANEVLDAMPINLVVWGQTIKERGVSVQDQDAEAHLIWQDQPATGPLLEAAKEIAQALAPKAGYQSEINLAARAWSAAWGNILKQGALLIFDYGFPQNEFYHAQRHGGTLMCHCRHRAHTDPFYLPGLQDITTHIDFTSVIAAAYPQGLSLLGYTSQARALTNCGLLDDLAQIPTDTLEYIHEAGMVNRLIGPAEMGELFKLIALGRNLDCDLIAFGQGDRSHHL